MSCDESGGADRADPVDAGGDPPLTVELLADLQAGLLDDEAAARVRRRIRADPAATAASRALNRVRCDVAGLVADSTSVPEPPPAVTANIAAVLRSANRSSAASRSPSGIGGHAAHSVRPSSSRAKVVAAVGGLCALIAAVGVGTAALAGAPAPMSSAPTTAQHITVSSPAVVIPLSDEQILGLLDRGPDYGPLSDPARRASCLSGLGYPVSTPILGARSLELNGHAGVLLVLPGDTADRLSVVAVPANCGAADTGLLASMVVTRR